MENRNLIIGGLLAFLVLIGGVWYFGFRDGGELTVPGDPREVVNEEQDIEFTYYGGWEGYTLLSSEGSASAVDPLLVQAYTLVDTQAYDANGRTTEGFGTQTPIISVLIFDEPAEATSTASTSLPQATGTTTGTSTDAEPEEPTLAEWAEAHSGFTAYGLREGESEEAEIDGITGIRFTSSGPFQSETYIIEHRGKYYVFLGQYSDEHPDLRTAFEKLLTDVFFL